jgi:hypothetical protein
MLAIILSCMHATKTFAASHVHGCWQQAAALEAMHSAACRMPVQQPQLAILNQPPPCIACALSNAVLDFRCSCLQLLQVHATRMELGCYC